jgi:hypothetical protein
MVAESRDILAPGEPAKLTAVYGTGTTAPASVWPGLPAGSVRIRPVTAPAAIQPARRTVIG